MQTNLHFSLSNSNSVTAKFFFQKTQIIDFCRRNCRMEALNVYLQISGCLLKLDAYIIKFHCQKLEMGLKMSMKI